ncbi:DUF2490 domain-containing protein [Pontibacter cellulosilyticus]|uniref:DUF2490 domain-containing protein n=1 Tax=Pontibacter cellulosilyticus TaxID=1720253 RepID=UPI00293BCCF0|nr:DUF2490 domain-containing protein [Pontibacter cellulosilyticus]
MGSWYIYIGSQQFNTKWNWHNEVQYRNYNAAGDLEQLLLRTGIGYNLTPANNNLLLGYAYILSEPYILGTDSKRSVSEHRIFQQFITRQQFSRFYLQHRYRIEQRFIEDTDFKMRYRYFLSVNVPLTNREMVPKTIYLSAYNEIFINDTSPLYDRNRLYSALGYTINKYLRAELGFMSQILENRHREQVQIVLFNNIPFSKD